MRARLKISEAKLAANRSNGRKSRGPRTAAGKSRASRNALRHGLAAITRHSPAFFPEIDRMAKAICNDDKDPFLLEQALTIAENQLILTCVRAERVAVVDRLRERTATPLRRDMSLKLAKARFRMAKLEYDRRIQATRVKSDPSTKEKEDMGARQQDTAGAKPVRQPQPRDEFEAMRCALPDLRRLDRYERRAWSRRKRAIRTFMAIRSRV